MNRPSKRPVFRLSAMCVAIAMAFNPMSVAHADVATWTGSVDTSWANGANWSGGVSPSFMDVIIDGASTVASSVFMDMSDTVKSLVIDAGDGLTNNGYTLTLGGSVTNQGLLTISGGALLLAADVTLAGTGQTVLNGGYIDSTGAAYTLTIDAGHTLKGNGYLSGYTGYNTSLVNKGTIIADNTAGSPLYFYGPSLDNTSGLIKVADGANFYVGSGTVSGGTVQGLGANSTIGGSGSFSNLLLKGGFNVSGSSFNNVVFEDTNVISSSANISGTITNKGSITINSGLLLASDVTLTGNGQTVLNGGYIDSTGAAYTLTIDTGHTLKGHGNLSGVTGYYASLVNKGTIIADNTAGNPLYFYGPNLDNSAGLIKVADGATFYVNSGTVSGGTVQSLGTNSTIGGGGSFSNMLIKGGINISGSSFNNVVFEDANVITSTATVSGTITNKGSITLNGTALLLGSDVTLTGTGQTVLNGGYIDSTGSSAYTLTIDTGHTLKGYGYLGGGYYGYYATNVTNKGTIFADNTAGSPLYFYGSSLDNTSGLIKVADGATFSVGNSTVSGGTVQGLGSGGATISGGTYKDLTLTGKLQASSATISGTINNKGSITINNSFLLLASDATLTGTGQTVLNGGYIDSTGSAHTLTIDTGHTLKGYGYVGGGYYGYNASLINKGTIIANTAGSSLTFYGPDFKNLGVVKVDVNSRLQVASANLVQDDAAAKTIVDGVLTAPQIELKAGTLSGNGEVVGAVLNTGGDVGPGASPGKLTITGDYTQTTGGRLTIDISGDEQGLSYDWLAISGYAALGGDLYLNVGYAPADGTSFTFLTSVLGVSGAFDHIYANGWKVATSYGANDVRVTLTAAAVPEPGSILMLLAGLGVVALARPRLAKQA